MPQRGVDSRPGRRPRGIEGLRSALLLGAMLLAPFAADRAASAADGNFQRSTVVIRGAHGRVLFKVRIAATPAQQERGLMFETRLPADEGMLFPQPAPRVTSMWMKNTYIPLDMLFIDEAGRIACLLANAEPQKLDILSCPKPVVAVLEIGGGEAAEHGIRVGDSVRYRSPAGP